MLECAQARRETRELNDLIEDGREVTERQVNIDAFMGQEE